MYAFGERAEVEADHGAFQPLVSGGGGFVAVGREGIIHLKLTPGLKPPSLGGFLLMTTDSWHTVVVISSFRGRINP
jgi:hypothetical protein